MKTNYFILFTILQIVAYTIIYFIILNLPMLLGVSLFIGTFISQVLLSYIIAKKYF